MRRASLCSIYWLLLGLVCSIGHATVRSVYPLATISVVGTEQSGDSGALKVDFNGYLESVSYGQFSTPSSLASALAAMFSRDYISFGLYAKADANGNDPNVVTFQLINGAAFGSVNIVGPSTSFSLTTGGFGPVATTVDRGTVALQLNGTIIASAAYGNGSTPTTIAHELTDTAASSLVTVTAEGANLYLQSTQAGTYSNPYNLVFSSNAGFATPSFGSIPASGTLSGASETAAVPVYSYSATYDANGNVETSSDSVMGNWNYTGGYDALNRLTMGQASSGPFAGQYACWGYDDFGNRKSEALSTTACSSSPVSRFQALFSANNRFSSVSAPAGTAYTYDNAGNILSDGQNSYLYDAEGRICALLGPEGMIGYQYDADGRRIGKGTITAMTTCDITLNGYQPIVDFVLDQSGGQTTEVSWSNGTPTIHHTNVEANGVLFATNDSLGWHYYLNDPLGSRRSQTDAAGFPEQFCQSLPFGEELFCSGSLIAPTEHHFTGKERDTESGLDNFGARYFSSNMGRFMSPDPSNQGVDFWLPQTWNRYAYVLNNPLSMVDKNGLWPTWVHNDIIDKAFPGLSGSQRDILKSASKDVDSYQGQAGSIYHNMSDPDPQAGLSDQTSQDFIEGAEDHARQLQADWIAQGHTGLSPAALTAFGNALHTITDGYSPSHEGGQYWCGTGVKCWPGGIWHFM